MKEYQKYLNEVFNNKVQMDEGFKDVIKNIWVKLSGDLGTIVSGILLATASLSPATMGGKALDSGNIIEAIAWIFVFVSMLGAGIFTTTSGYFSIKTVGQIVDDIKKFVMGRLKSKEELEKLSSLAQEIIEIPELKKYKGFITGTQNKIKNAIERKDWTDAWRYVQILKQKLEEYKRNIPVMGGND